MKKIFLSLITGAFLLFSVPTVACNKDTCNPKECGVDCGCGCKNDMFQKWQFWALLATAVIITIALVRRSKFEKVNPNE